MNRGLSRLELVLFLDLFVSILALSLLESAQNKLLQHGFNNQLVSKLGNDQADIAPDIGHLSG